LSFYVNTKEDEKEEKIKRWSYINMKKGNTYYLIKWQDYDNESNTWEKKKKRTLTALKN